MLDFITISSQAFPRDTRVIGFRGSEGLSRLYAFEIHLELAADAGDAFELSGAIGAKGALVLDRQDGRPPFVFHGIFSEATLVHHEPDGRAFLRAVLVPHLWRLTQTLHSRIFTQQSIPDILKKTLDDGGLTSSDYSFQLTGQYDLEEHVCQYRESGFAFFSRWMEREGLYYFFEQGDDGEKLVVADDKSAHEALVPRPVRYFPLLGHDVTAGECLHTFLCRQRALPASVRFKDYDHTKPSLDVSGVAPVSPTGVGEVSVHGARFFTPDAGKRLAKLRAEEMLAREQVFTGSGTALYLRAGYTFELTEHPRSAFDAKYLVTDVEHFGNQAARTPEMLRLTGLADLAEGEVYRVDVTAIPATVQFRAESRAVWPRIYGTEHGTVDGEADSEYAQLDEHGRYLVRFAFDESDLADGKASTRVRMMQPHGGGVEGWHFPLRKGTEVLFTFLGGDPDRPVIAGVVPNALKPSPITQANQTRNVIQTGGRNRLEIEDKKGFERITWTTPYANTMIRMGAPNADHEMIVRTDGATVLETGQNWDVDVGGALWEHVKEVVNEHYESSHTTKVDVGRFETVTSGGMTTDIVGGWFHSVDGGGSMDIDGGFKLTVTGNSSHIINGDAQTLVMGSEAHVVTSSATHVVSGPVTTNYGPWNGIMASVDWTIPGGATITAPKWKVKTGNFWDTFGMKNMAGIESMSFAAISMSGGGLKIDTTGIGVSLGVAKIENRGIKKGEYGLDGEAAAVQLWRGGVSLKNIAASIRSAGVFVWK